MLNIGSLILGVCAWLLGTLAIITKKVHTSYRNTVLSSSFCLFSLIFQLFEMNRRVLLKDYAAIEDTIRAILIASVVLVSITIVLNVFAVINVKHK